LSLRIGRDRRCTQHEQCRRQGHREFSHKSLLLVLPGR
jgi:hypothetical protein